MTKRPGLSVLPELTELHALTELAELPGLAVPRETTGLT
jgi:hypothetical protein